MNDLNNLASLFTALVVAGVGMYKAIMAIVAAFKKGQAK